MGRGFTVLYCVALMASLPVHSQNVAIISSGPPVSPQAVADLEARVRSDPGDVETRIQLLRVYANNAVPNYDDARRRLARLDQILYLIDHHPGISPLGTQLAYVSGTGGAYANQDDHRAAARHWLSAVDAHPATAAVVVNAVRFLAVEDKSDAENVLQKAIAADPENREIAANLGFLYAMEILGLDSLIAGAQSSGAGPDLAAHANTELERTSNPLVLAGAGTAIPNLAMAATPRSAPDPKLFDLAASLSARARQLAPGDRDIQGPMPLIRYFAAAHETSAGSPGLPPPFPAVTAGPANFSVPGNTQPAVLIRKTAPEYPDAARAAGITGAVRLRVVIARDGSVKTVQLIEGHPLLVSAALHAVENWVYKPTLLNGSPVELTTEISVQFPPE